MRDGPMQHGGARVANVRMHSEQEIRRAAHEVSVAVREEAHIERCNQHRVQVKQRADDGQARRRTASVALEAALLGF